MKTPGRAGHLGTSDAVSVPDELATLPKVIDVSRRARRLISANLIIAATVIAALSSGTSPGTCHYLSALPGTKGPPSSSASTRRGCSAPAHGDTPPHRRQD